MKRRITILLSSVALAFALVAVGLWGLAPATARAEEKEITHIESAENELLYYGDVIDSKATVHYTDGTSEERSVNWENLNAIEVNQNFTMVEAIGTVEGTSEKVSRRFFTLPRGLVYFVNCGSYTGQPIENEININDVYYDLNTAILENYEAPTGSGKLLNEVPDQEKASSNDWGYTPYTANYKVSSKQMPTKAGDPMPPAYPYNAIRASDQKDLDYGIEYTLGGLASGNYKVYIGTRSHWHSRNITPYINGEAKDKYNIDAVPKITAYEDVPSVDGKIKIHLAGGAGQNEANIAFVAIQTMEAVENTPSSAPEAIERTENLEMGVNEFDVENVAAGSKVQISLASGSYNVLYESIAGDSDVGENGKYTVRVPDGTFDGIFALRLTAVNAAGASDSIVIYITDISEESFTPRTTAYTTGNVVFDIHGEADSNIVRLVVNFDYVDTVFTEEEDPALGDTVYDGTYTVKQNGVYTFTLYSGNGAFVSKSYEVTNIDNRDVTLSVNMATKGFTGGKVRVVLAYDGATEANGYTLYNSVGEKIKSGTEVSDAFDLEAGRYVFSVVSESGKTATASVFVSDTPTYFKATAAKVSGGTTYTLTGVEKEISRIYAVSLDDAGTATRLMGSGTSVNEYAGATVMVRVEYTDGTVEFAPMIATTASKKKCGSELGATSAIAALAALVCCGVILLRRKAEAHK